MSDTTGSNDSPSRMFTFRSGGWVLALAGVFVVAIVIGRLIYIAPTFAHRAVGDGVNVETYGFDLANFAGSRETLVAGGLPRDGLPTLNMPLTVTVAEAGASRLLGDVRKLVPLDRVAGVTINGESRAYPLWILNWHEICNDIVGGEPIAVTYSPLCDSVVVFSRRVAGKTLEFGYSGLLWNSNLLMYDRAPAEKSTPAGSAPATTPPHSASLWSQLQFGAVSGPAAGQSLEIIPVELTIWSQWSVSHPDTRIILPDLSRKRVYKREAYQHYFSSGKLRFPVAPLPTNASDYMTRILALRDPDGWRVDRATPDLPSTTHDRPQVYAFWFAWHAFHPQTPPPAAP